MSRNIKEIGKELMGKSLNSFHRKTGLTQLEENNKMQDGILDGILSQVDDAYIEKTEQSNVIHLDGSGDGVVVLDSIEGNTMVNLHPTDLKIGSGDGQDSSTTWHVGVNMDKTRIKPNTYYTVFVLNSSSKVNRCYFNLCRNTVLTLNENKSSLFYTDDYEKSIAYIHFYSTEPVPKSEVINTKIVVLEGDYTNCNINFFEGLQSSFEEYKEEDKYKIEILSNNKNLFDVNKHTLLKSTDNYIEVTTVSNENIKYKLKPNTNYTLSFKKVSDPCWIAVVVNDVYVNNSSLDFARTYTTGNDGILNISIRANGSGDIGHRICDLILEEGNQVTTYVPHKQNKIKLLLNEPLRGLPNGVKDRLVRIGDKCYIERNLYQTKFNTDNFTIDIPSGSFANGYQGVHAKIKNQYIPIKSNPSNSNKFIISDKVGIIGAYDNNMGDIEGVGIWADSTADVIGRFKVNTIEYDGNATKQYINNLDLTVVYQLSEPYYEEILNEYGKPILLEGYENGEKIEKQLNGFFARLVQHECDHLDGIVFLERVKEKNGFATVDNINKYNLRNEK